MVTAILNDDCIESPSVGKWFPAVSDGTLVGEQSILGRLWQNRKWVVVTVPKRVNGMVRFQAAPGQFCERGTPLCTVHEGSEISMSSSASNVTGSVEHEGAYAMKADTDGTMYLRPSPDASPYVNLKDVVSRNQTLALVEVMKTFSPVRASIDGEVVGIEVEDGDSVMAGDVLFWVRPT